MESSSWRLLDSYTSSSGHLSSRPKKSRGSWISERPRTDPVYASCGILEEASDRASQLSRSSNNLHHVGI